MDASEVVTRARGQIGRGTIYKLGCGGIHPDLDRPSDAAWNCDCSGFVWWCLGRSRFDGKQWWDTSAIFADAMHHPPGALFEYHPWTEGKPGDVLVYGDKGGHQGHIGIVSVSGADGPEKIIHCSHGNYEHTGDAIGETAPDVFRAGDAIVARPKWYIA
jgi:cell wall-associated NlpC family hydrolase